MSTIVIPEGYEYVGAALVSTVWLLFYQVRNVVKYREKSGVKYPQLYAEKAEAEASVDVMKFNCAQRAHQATLENLPIMLTTTLIGGLKYPRFVAASCFLWVVGRASFTRGYSSGDADKRVTLLYKLSYIGVLGTLCASTYLAGEWVFAGISKAVL